MESVHVRGVIGLVPSLLVQRSLRARLVSIALINRGV